MIYQPRDSVDEEVAAALAQRYGIEPADVETIAKAVAEAKGLLSPSDLHAGLSSVVGVYLRVLESTVDRFADPAERAIAERFAGLVVDQLANQLQSATYRRN